MFPLRSDGTQNCAFPGKFVQALQTGSYKVVRGDKRNGTFLGLELVNSFNLGRADLHIIPVAKGASNSKGTAKTILGVALIGGAIFLSGGTLAAPLAHMGTAVSIGGTSLGFTWGTIAAIGLGLTLAGISTLMSNPATKEEKTDSYSISGPTNTGQQGSAISLVYGECIVGAIGVSFDADIENIGAYAGINDPAFDGTKALFPGGAY
jgi:predicted phage tail protein